MSKRELGQIYRDKANGSEWTLVSEVPGSVMLQHRFKPATRLVTVEALEKDFELQIRGEAAPVADETKTRTDLIGQTGTVTRSLKIIDAKEGKYSVDVRVKEDESGNEYWTGLEDIELD